MKEAVETFIREIMSSEEYREYAYERDKVKQYPDLKAQIDDYRSKNFQVQTSQDTAFERIEQFEREYAGFRENQMVADFLASELAFCRMMQRIWLEIIDALDFE